MNTQQASRSTTLMFTSSLAAIHNFFERDNRHHQLIVSSHLSFQILFCFCFCSTLRFISMLLQKYAETFEAHQETKMLNNFKAGHLRIRFHKLHNCWSHMSGDFPVFVCWFVQTVPIWF